MRYTIEIYKKYNIRDRQELEVKIEEIQFYIGKVKTELSMMVSARPVDIVPDKDWEPLEYAVKRFDDLMAEYDEYNAQLADLVSLRDKDVWNSIEYDD